MVMHALYEWRNLSNVWVVTGSDVLSLAYEAPDGTEYIAPIKEVDDYLHEKFHERYPAIDPTDLVWQESMYESWVHTSRELVIETIKRLEKGGKQVSKYWNNVEFVLQKDDKIWIEDRSRKADYVLVENTLYTYFSDSVDSDIVCNPDEFVKWCSEHEQIVRDCIVRFEEESPDDYAGETKLVDDAREYPKLIHTRTNSMIEIADGVSVLEQHDLDMTEDSSYKVTVWVKSEDFNKLCKLYTPTSSLMFADALIREALVCLFGLKVTRQCESVELIEHSSQLCFKYSVPVV